MRSAETPTRPTYQARRSIGFEYKPMCCAAGSAVSPGACSLAGSEWQSIRLASAMRWISIAGAVIGGVSIFGGAGSVVGVVLGGAAMAIIRNGLVLLQIGASWQTLLTGAVIVTAFAIDRVRRRIRNYG